jgi:hypothetical protein
VQAKTAQTTIVGNVMFNGACAFVRARARACVRVRASTLLVTLTSCTLQLPHAGPRAGINANDGFGGGDAILHNLVFSTCRESGDHGPYNSWDRQPFLTTVLDGTPSVTPAPREISFNFFIDNYSPQECVDNDDGSQYYNTHHNFMVYGSTGMKNDFGGHDNHHHDNVYCFVSDAVDFFDAPMLDGHEDEFDHNRVVLTHSTFGYATCNGTGATRVHDNQYFTPDGSLAECHMSLAEWQAEGRDVGSTVSVGPPDSTVVQWGRDLLFPALAEYRKDQH